MKKLRLIPPFTTFFAGSITIIWLYLADANLLDTLVILFAVLFVFYFIGVVIMKLLQDIWIDEIQKEREAKLKALEEEKMVEKEVVEDKEIKKSEG